MAEPKSLLEAALYSHLSTECSSYDVYNTVAVGSSFDYIVFQSVGGGDEDFHRKDRGRIYEYQIVGLNTDRAEALAMFVAIDAAMATAKVSLSVNGQSIVRVTRTGPVDYTEPLPDGTQIHRVGAIYEVELEEA